MHDAGPEDHGERGRRDEVEERLGAHELGRVGDRAHHADHHEGEHRALLDHGNRRLGVAAEVAEALGTVLQRVLGVRVGEVVHHTHHARIHHLLAQHGLARQIAQHRGAAPACARLVRARDLHELGGHEPWDHAEVAHRDAALREEGERGEDRAAGLARVGVAILVNARLDDRAEQPLLHQLLVARVVVRDGGERARAQRSDLRGTAQQHPRQRAEHAVAHHLLDVVVHRGKVAQRGRAAAQDARLPKVREAHQRRDDPRGDGGFASRAAAREVVERERERLDDRGLAHLLGHAEERRQRARAEDDVVDLLVAQNVAKGRRAARARLVVGHGAEVDERLDRAVAHNVEDAVLERREVV
mmetsp:Transcript_69835/g.195253  ORF Transcript_69835/g.195253 Transcript_69835/m.195253 type:complete len:358 (-) Transcript_69835:1888-2961(-)